MNKNTAHIAIVGGGFSGTLATIRLVKLLTETKNSAKIFLIEKTKKLAKGLAYDTQCDLHLLNVPAQDMSAYPEDRDNFINWLSKRFSAVAPSAFVSRKIYGEYLSEQLQIVLDTKSGVEVEVINDEAVALSKDETNLTLASGRIIEVDKVVLATGNFQPSEVITPKVPSGQSDAFINNPWDANALSGLSVHDNVLLIGTGLTMIDLAVQLYSAGHQGIITAISRHGLLPNKHRVFNRIEGATPQELLPTVLPLKVREVFSTVRAACTKAEGAESDWRLVINQLRPHTQSIWKSFDATDKKRFLRHARPLWEVLRHRMPPDVANIIESMREDYRLRIVSGRLLTVVADGNSAQVTMRLRRSGRVQTASYRRIINCTGPNIDLRDTSDNFIQSLIRSGSIKADELGLGLQVDELGYAIKPDQTRSDKVLAIGALRKGQLWETTAVPELRVQAAQLAQQVVDSLVASVVAGNAVETGITSA